MSYNSYEDENKQPKPMGYTITLDGPQQTTQEDPIRDDHLAKEFYKARIRDMHARARMAENNLIQQSMNQILNGLAACTVDSGDKGGDNRPPLIPAFDEINRGKLQQCYLRLAERLINHVEFFMVTESRIKLTNEIKLAPEGDKDGVQ